MMRITWDAPALVAVRNLLGGTVSPPMPRFGRRGVAGRACRTTFEAERLEPRMMLDAGMLARLPILVASSDTGISAVDRVTADRTPTLTGSVGGGASHVRLAIDGSLGDPIPLTNGSWTHTVPAQTPLAAGRHSITVVPFNAFGEAGRPSSPLRLTVRTAPPSAPTLLLGTQSDTGVKGDGKTTSETIVLRGFAQPGRQVQVSIDGLPAGRVWSDAKTGAWFIKSPRLATGVHQVTALATDRAGVVSTATSLPVTVEGSRTVMLDAAGGGAVELMASHLLGRGSQGFTVTKVHGGTLQKWSAAMNSWQTIPAAPSGRTAAPWRISTLRTVSSTDVVRWIPSATARGIGAAFDVVPLDRAGAATAPAPAADTVPGRLVAPRVVADDGVGTTIAWEKPADGCGCGSTRYSVQVTREDGRTLLYNLANTVNKLAVVEGGRVEYATMWAATKTGAGDAQFYDALLQQIAKNRIAYTALSGLSTIDLGTKARAQLASSPTGVGSDQTSFVLGGSHADLAYLEVQAVPDAVEAAQGLPAGSVPLISSDSNRLTPRQKAELEQHPILARYLFPGTVAGDVQPDQVRVHFQAGETLRFAGNVDASVRAGATIVVESAQNLGDGSLGPWLEDARIPVGADGGYAHDFVVPYGLNSVRTRLEYRMQPAPAAFRAASGPIVGSSASSSAPISTPIDLSSSYNAFGITTPPWQVPNNQGFDRNGNYYDSDYTGPGTRDPVPGTPIQYKGIEFPIGPIPTEDGQVGGGRDSATHNPYNFVQAKGQSITVNVDADKSDYLYLAGAASNGNQTSQAITLKFTDGTTETWTQSFHDWASAGPSQQDVQSQPTQPKLPVRVVATSMVYGGPSGLQTIDGIALVAGDRVLLQNQSASPADNGIYVVEEGLWSRSKDTDTGAELLGASTSVMAGTYAGQTFVNTNTGTIEIGVTAVAFAEGKPPVPAPRPFAGELLLKTEPERINQLGDLVTTPAHIFAYCRNLHGKQLESITLPNNDNIGILSAVVAKAPVIALDEGVVSVVLGTVHLTGVDVVALTIRNESNIGAGGGPLTFFFADQPVKGSVATPSQPATYTTKQVTVPMGQQTTIAYVAPDQTSQVTFQVQKADGTCVGANCSTYLTDWKGGSGSSSDWAENISPSLNSQLKAGQHWTMTIQNAGEGYYGYLDSPSGTGLPGASGSTPAGAQFRLMTATEISVQPPWAVAIETAVGTALALVGLALVTGGAGDAAVIGAEGVDLAVSAADTSSVIAVDGGSFTESVVADALSESLISDAEISVDEGDILMNLDDEAFEESHIVRRDSINDIDEVADWDPDTYQRWLVRQ